MSEVKAQYSFGVIETSNGWQFDYKRSKYGSQFGCAFAPLALIVIIVVIIGQNMDARTSASLQSIVIDIILWASISIFGLIFLLNKFKRKPGQVILTENTLIVEGKSYDRKEISSFWIQGTTKQTKQTINTNEGFVLGFGVANNVAQSAKIASDGGREVLNIFARGFDKVNQKIMFQYAERKVKLAGGLKEESASALLKAILEKG